MAEKLYLPINLKVDGRKKAQKKPLPLRPPVFPPVEPLDLEERLRRLREQEYIQETERLPFAPRTLPVRSLAERLLAQREGQVLRPPVTFQGRTPREMLFPQELRMPFMGGRGLPGIEPEPEPRELQPFPPGFGESSLDMPKMALGVAKGLVSPFIPPQWGIGKRIGIEPIEWETQPTPMGAIAAIPGGALIGPEMAAIGAGMKGLARAAPQLGRATRARVSEMPALTRRAMAEEAGGVKLGSEAASLRIRKFLKPELQKEFETVKKQFTDYGFDLDAVAGPSPNQWFLIAEKPTKLPTWVTSEAYNKAPLGLRQWHATGMREEQQRAFTDLASVKRFLGTGEFQSPKLIFPKAEGPETTYKISPQMQPIKLPPSQRPYRAPPVKSVEGYRKEFLAREAEMKEMSELSDIARLQRELDEVYETRPLQQSQIDIVNAKLEKYPVKLRQKASRFPELADLTITQMETFPQAPKPAVALQPVKLPSPANIDVELKKIRSIIADTTLTPLVRSTARRIFVYAAVEDTRSLARYGRALDEAIISQSLQQNEVSANALRRLKVSIDRIIGNIPSGKPVAEAAVRPPTAVPEGVPVRPVPRGEMPSAPPPGPKAGWETGAERPFAFDPNSTKNEGRFRLLPPESVTEYFRRQSSTPGVSYVMGKDASGKTVTQAIRFDKAKFTEREAGKWWQANKGRLGVAEAPPTKPPVKPPTTVGGAPPKGPLDPQAVVKEWTAQIREAKKLRGPTAEAISKERAKRKAIIEKALVGKRGEEARRAAFGAAKGEILTPEFEPASQVFTPEKAELLQEMIRDRFQKDAYRYLPAQTAFDKLFTGGRIPAPSEMAALEEVFGSEFIKAVLDKRGGGIKAWELFIELWNVPKAMKAAYDISDTLRQGAFLLLEGNPAKEAFKARMRSLVSEKAFEAVNESIAANKWYDLSQSLGRDSLDLTLPRVARGLVGKEEPYIGARLAEKIPIIGKGVRMSERAYTAGLNKIRMDTFAQQAEILQKQGADIEAFKKLAWNINVMSGRGSLGKFTQAAMLLNLPFFSPRFATSRFQMPLIFATKNPVLLKMALKDVVGYISSVFAMEALLDLAGVAEVEWDTRSSDFAKVRIGNTRFDPFAGFQQPVVFVAQLIAGKRKTLATGAMVPVDPRERVGQFAETKLATTPGALLALKRGKAYGGEKLTPANFLTSLLVPMTMEDVWEAAQEGKGLADSILWGLGAGVPAALGVGVQTFGIADWQKDFKDYIAIPTSATEREAKGIRLSREKYRERNPEIDAKLFILGEVTSLQTEDSVTAALRLIQENKIDPEDIKGIKAKMDDAKERQKLGLAPKPDDTLVGYLMNELKAQKLREVLGITPKPTPGKSLRDLLPITPTPQNLRELLPAGVR